MDDVVRAYDIHDNGGRPFTVLVDGNNGVSVVKRHYDAEKENWVSSSVILQQNFTHIFIGKNRQSSLFDFQNRIDDKSTEIYNHYGFIAEDDDDGNSILLFDGKNNTYVFVGNLIFRFQSLYPIIEFVSPIGNSDVPYAYAVDSHYNFYLFNEKVIIDGNKGLLSDINFAKNQNLKDPYAWYYNILSNNPTYFEGNARDILIMEYCEEQAENLARIT